ncbi:MAG: hypothetical protein H6836_03490 [Planctomycetes bacterium]|nr:hypothetical protein [Planctomycetota bacterium]MCB9888616.1 hypothetical protein [Planctomycetota bacterium]
MQPRRTRITSAADLLWLAQRHRSYAVGAVVAVLVITALVYLFLPRSYRSQAHLLLRVGRESVRPDPTVTMGPTIGVNQSRESELNSEVLILRSQDLLRAVVESVTPDSGDRRVALGRLERSLRVSPAPISNVITVSVGASDAEHAQRTLAKLLDLYLVKHIRSHRTPESESFFRKQAERVGERIEVLRAALRDKLQGLGIHSLESHRAALLARVASLATEQEGLGASIAAAVAKIQQLSISINGLDAMHTLEEASGAGNQVADEIQKRLVALRMRERELLAKYPPESRVVRDVVEQIKLASALLEGEERARTTVRRGLNANRQRLELDLLTERGNLAALEARRDKLRFQQENVSKRLNTVRDHEGELVALEGQLRVLEAERQRYLSGLEQARADAAMGTERISNISVVQAPTLPSGPSGPPRLWILVAGVLLAMTAGLGAVVARDLFDRSLLVPGDVPRLLDAELLAALPRHEALHLPARGKPLGSPAAGAVDEPSGDTAGSTAEGSSPALPAAVIRELELLVGRVLSGRAPSHTLAVVAPQRGVGASTVAFHLASRLAEARLGRVLLVDCARSTPDHGGGHVMESVGPALSTLRCGDPLDVAQVLCDIRAQSTGAAFVVLDLPAITESSFAVELARAAAQTLLVVDTEVTDLTDAQRSLRVLEHNEIRLLGVVLNRASTASRSSER